MEERKTQNLKNIDTKKGISRQVTEKIEDHEGIL
jgi:hypothetical protein